eukprot:Hpha_TRINITY_DN7519_c0_g1::TRINITY_DN7519_c0_g1_i1::g.18899::m.18899
MDGWMKEDHEEEQSCHRPRCLVPTLYENGGRDGHIFGALESFVMCAMYAPPAKAPKPEKRGWCDCRPDDSDAVEVDSWRFDGHWKPTEAQIEELFHSIDHSGDRGLTRREIQAFATSAENTSMVRRKYPASIHGVVNEELVIHAFDHLDRDGDGELDLDEFKALLAQLEKEKIKFLLAHAFVAYRTFYGRGNVKWRSFFNPPDVGIDPVEAWKICEDLEVRREDEPLEGTNEGNGVICGREPDGLFPTGYWSDFYYYSANVHPIHGIFACDPSHRLAPIERLALELATIGYCFWSNKLNTEWTVEKRAPFDFLEDPTVFSLTVVTVGGMFVWYLLYYLFICPWGSYDGTEMSGRMINYKKNITWYNQVVGWFITAALFILLVIFVYRHIMMFMCDTQSHVCVEAVKQVRAEVAEVLTARIRSYFISWGLQFFAWFNPIFAWGSWTNSSHIGNMFGIGQWKLERRIFKMKCHDIYLTHIHGGHHPAQGKQGDYGAIP